MRHRKIRGRLSRRTSYRKAALKSLAISLFKYQRIKTTLAKAKALRRFIEPLITLAKNPRNALNAKRRAFSELSNETIVNLLFGKIAPLYKDINGGYTRIMPFKNRKGDGAELAIIELVKRTIKDEELLGAIEKKTKPKKKKGLAPLSLAGKGEVKKDEGEMLPEGKHVAPEVAIEEKEKRAVEDVKKEKAKQEQKKIIQKGGIFKIFRRKSIG